MTGISADTEGGNRENGQEVPENRGVRAQRWEPCRVWGGRGGEPRPERRLGRHTGVTWDLCLLRA